MLGTIAKMGIVVILGLAVWVWYRQSQENDLSELTLTPSQRNAIIGNLDLRITPGMLASVAGGES